LALLLAEGLTGAVSEAGAFAVLYIGMFGTLLAAIFAFPRLWSGDRR
jgi:hypothetical protein